MKSLKFFAATTALSLLMPGAALAQQCVANQTTVCPTSHPHIVPTPKVYVVYWGWGCTGAAGCNGKWGLNTDPVHNLTNQSEILALEAMLDNAWGGANVDGLGGSRWLNTLVQYPGFQYDPSGPGNEFNVTFTNPNNSLAGEWFDNTDAYVDLQAQDSRTSVNIGQGARDDEVWLAAQHFGVIGNPNAIILVARPPGSQTAVPGSCAYHSFLGVGAPTPTRTQNITYPELYIDLNYNGLFNNGTAACTSACNVGSACEVTVAAGHELAETISDPYEDGYVDRADSSTPEVADLCTSAPFHTMALQPRGSSWGDPYKNVTLQPLADDHAGPNGACTFAFMSHSDTFVYGTGTPAHVFRQTQSEPGAGVSSPQSYWDWGTLNTSGRLVSSPMATSWGPGRVDVFAVDSIGHLVHGYTDQGNPGCVGPGNPCTDDWGPLTADGSFTFLTGQIPVVVSWGPGRLDLFVIGVSAGSRGNGHTVFQRTWDSGNDTGWINRGVPSGISPANLNYVAAATYGPGEVDLWLTDGHVIYSAAYSEPYPYNGTSPAFTGWSTWLGGQVFNNQPVIWHSAPSAAEWLYNRVDLVILDGNGVAWDCTGTASGSVGTASVGFCTEWGTPSGITLGGQSGSGPGLVALGDQRLLLSARGSDGQLWLNLFDHNLNTGGWVPGGGGLAINTSVTASAW